MNKVIFSFFIGCLIVFLSCSTKGYKRGEILYNAYCSDCHMDDGSGLEGLYPPIDQSEYLKKHQNELACMIRYGFEGEIVVNGKTYNQKMVGFPKIKDSDIANIVNFINYKFLNQENYINIKEIKNMLENCNQ